MQQAADQHPGDNADHRAGYDPGDKQRGRIIDQCRIFDDHHRSSKLPGIVKNTAENAEHNGRDIRFFLEECHGTQTEYGTGKAVDNSK